MDGDQSDKNRVETEETQDEAPGCANATQVETTEVASIRDCTYWTKRAVVMERLLRSLRESKLQLDKSKRTTASGQLNNYDTEDKETASEIRTEEPTTKAEASKSPGEMEKGHEWRTLREKRLFNSTLVALNLRRKKKKKHKKYQLVDN